MVKLSVEKRNASSSSLQWNRAKMLGSPLS